MKAKLAQTITRLYPPAWRERYGEEFAAMLELGPGDFGTLLDSLGAAVREHIFPTLFSTQGGNMEQDPNSFGAMMRRPSAYLPVAMSLTSLVVVLSVVGYGAWQAGHVVRDTNEGAAAHIFQILMTVQWPITLFFLVKWLRRNPGQTLRVFAVQAAAWVAGCAPVYFLHL